jgi:oxygen-independent coproporphyrinogen-3 oxidase
MTPSTHPLSLDRPEPAPSPAGPDFDLPELSEELLRRYDTQGPRYTSYPTTRQLTQSFGEEDYRRHATAAHERSAGSPLSLYIHVPFCESPCFYCGCNRIVTRDHAAADRYIANLSREIAQVSALFDEGREVRQLHLGGGTPSFLSPQQLSDLVGTLAQHWPLTTSAGRDFSIEIDPRFVPQGFIETLARLGFNRVSLGVQDFDPDVQGAVNRIQSVEQTLAVIAECRAHGFTSINIDLLYGLPLQTVPGFRRTLRTVIQARPERLAIYGYAHLPQLFKAQRQLDASLLPDPGTRLALLRLAIEELGAAGYRYIGLDHFALPSDDLVRAQARGDLQRNFMGYTTHGGYDLVSLGVSAISHVGDSFSQNHRDLAHWEAALEAGRLPVWRGLSLSADDVVRADVIQRVMCLGEVDIGAVEQQHGITFADYFAGALAQLARLADDGLVTVGQTRIRASTRGRLLLRLIAMCFDRYLEAPAPGVVRDTAAPTPFSRVI